MVIDEPFTVFAEFLEYRDIQVDEGMGPVIVTDLSKSRRRAGEQDQKGTVLAGRHASLVRWLAAVATTHA